MLVPPIATVSIPDAMTWWNEKNTAIQTTGREVNVKAIMVLTVDAVWVVTILGRATVFIEMVTVVLTVVAMVLVMMVLALIETVKHILITEDPVVTVIEGTAEDSNHNMYNI